MTVSVINKVFSFGAIIFQACIALAILYWVFSKGKYQAVATTLGKHGLALSFVISLTATVGSLFYSNVAGFAPCDLCWFQRIFMYPLVVLTGLALVKKDRKVADYILLLSSIGGVISLYHNVMYYYNGGLNVFCNLGGSQVSCIKRYVFEFGYMTIPLMSLTVFIAIAILMIFIKAYERAQ